MSGDGGIQGNKRKWAQNQPRLNQYRSRLSQWMLVLFREVQESNNAADIFE